MSPRDINEEFQLQIAASAIRQAQARLKLAVKRAKKGNAHGNILMLLVSHIEELDVAHDLLAPSLDDEPETPAEGSAS